VRDRVDHDLAHRSSTPFDDHQQKDHETLGDDHAHGVGPREDADADETEGHEGVDAHAGSQAERLPGIEAHCERGQPGTERRDREHLVEVEGVSGAVLHAGEDPRIDEHDVRHREEDHQPADYLRAHTGARFGDAEIPVES
jgi:hypothetical protein